MKVEVKDKTGRVKVMDDRYARVLSRMGRVTYLTRDMQAAPPPAPPVVLPVTPPQVEASQTADSTQAKPKRKYTRKAKAGE